MSRTFVHPVYQQNLRFPPHAVVEGFHLGPLFEKTVLFFMVSTTLCTSSDFLFLFAPGVCSWMSGECVSVCMCVLVHVCTLRIRIRIDTHTSFAIGIDDLQESLFMGLPTCFTPNLFEAPDGVMVMMWRE